MSLELVPQDIRDAYEIHEWKHALSILAGDFPQEWDDIQKVLRAFQLKKSDVGVPGKNISGVSKYFNKAFRDFGWVEKSFDTKISVDGNEMASPTHLVDCFKNRIALEIEWSNKDPFFDRDLNNFRLLFELRAASVGVIITKSNDLIKTLKKLGIFSKYGMTTTWMSKLLPRINGGGGGGCPLVVFGIMGAKYVEDVSDAQLKALVEQAEKEKKARKDKAAKRKAAAKTPEELEKIEREEGEDDESEAEEE